MRDTTRHPNLPDYTLQAYMNLRSRCSGFYEPDERCPRVGHCVCYSTRRAVETGIPREEEARVPPTRGQVQAQITSERRRAWRFAISMVLLIFGLGIIGGLLSGCTTTAYERPAGVYVGPYDITLSSHREALGLDP